MTVQLLMQFGGAEYYFRRKPTDNNEMVQLIGRELTIKLAQATNIPRRIPLAKPRLAQYFRAHGETIIVIARKLKSTETSVSKWINDAQQDQV